MIRIWKGVEQEALNKWSAVDTLFVCADVVLQADTICSFLSCNDVEALYLGAGRVPFCGIREWTKLVDFCDARDIKIIMEVLPENLKESIQNFQCDIIKFIVVYYDMPKNVDNLYFKTDDYNLVRLYKLNKLVDVTQLSNEMYKDDILLYKED